ncbi:MAG: hypothetical protein RL266_2265 [Bacteroidota bacterium]|jgi:DNA-binding protein YbaB
MFDKLKQLQQMKEQMDAAKERLNHISVRGECQGITVIANGNKKILEVVIPAGMENDEIAELVVIATNKALESAENVFESEMRGMAGGLMGGLGF